MNIRHEFRKLLWRHGFDIVPFDSSSHPLARRKQILDIYEIDTVIDVGANTGQFARQLRCDLSYTNRILSFEPLGSAFELLEANARGDPKWQVFRLALGDIDAVRQINIAANSCSSSLLTMLPAHLRAAPQSQYVGMETIELRTLDSLFPELCKESQNIYLKIDAQGYESRVLKGAEHALQNIDTLQMEMSLVPLYEGEELFLETCTSMQKRGFTLIAIENGFADAASGQLLQIDGIFHRATRRSGKVDHSPRA